ncbi:hypothetical protein CYQ88_02535 [Hydrogenovibrio sp. SC-1]|uniref:DctP family TRAP transporter solute-binding subunit n=1 Tax=Hydrogenovibrio sp. SC-1 TaxID=2065820 RepID=UPI000C7A782C|nr:DctP family TRAP transporter solute-binding subunit [Hydrogenovibrio sp. SC-1]PLA75122.1 hypothetical protein CYQ88_02535 [Hydrogenovibrio sp. SC-1]
MSFLAGIKPASQPAPLTAITPSVFHLKLGLDAPENTALHQAVLRFAERVQTESHGRIQVEIFPNQVLGNVYQMIEMTRKGQLDILLIPSAKLSISIPSMQYPDIPFLFPTREDAYQLLDGEPGQLLLQKLNSIGLLGITFWENGFKHFTGNQFYTHPDDFVGKKFRIMKSRLLESQFNALGAEAIPIDFHSTYQALKDGVVDGQENPLVSIASMGFHKEQSHLTLSDHGYLSYVFAFSQHTFPELPQDLKTLLIKTARDLTRWERQETQRRENTFLQQIQAEGVQITQLTPAQRQTLAQKTTHLIQQFEPIIGSDIISYTQTYLNQKYALTTPDKLAIGLNADLSAEAPQAGLAIKRGMELAIAEINAQGGLLGKELVLLPMDHRTLASRGQENLKHLANEKPVIAVMGGVHSAVVMAERPLINQLKIPYLIPWAAASEITKLDGSHDFLFRLSIDDDIGAKKLADFSAELRCASPAVIVENSIWGRGNLEQIKNHLAKKSIPIAVEVTLNRGQQHFDSIIHQLTQSGADSIILVANSKEATGLVKSLSQSQTLLPIISHWGIASGDFFNQTKSLFSKLNLHLIQTWIFSNQTQKAPIWQRYLQAYKTIDSPYAVNGMVQAYDLVKLLALAVTTAKSTDRQAIQQALENLPPYQGVLKYYQQAFSAKDHDALNEKDIFMVKLLPDGRLVKTETEGQ